MNKNILSNLTINRLSKEQFDQAGINSELQADALYIAKGVKFLDEAVIDVNALPTENINDKAVYRVLTGTFIQNGCRYDDWTCHVVDTLPASGEIFSYENFVGYYNKTDNKVYIYTGSDWFDVMTVAGSTAFGFTYPPVWDAKEQNLDGSFSLLLEYKLYTYTKDYGWQICDTIGRAGEGHSAETFNHPQNSASGITAHAEGYVTDAEGNYSHAEGYQTHASGRAAHTEGMETYASGTGAHAEGLNTNALVEGAHVEGYGTIVGTRAGDYGAEYDLGYYGHAEGQETCVYNNFGHAEGFKSSASGIASHVEGFETQALGTYYIDSSELDGYNTIASGFGAKDFGANHAEGFKTEATEAYAHAEGYKTIANEKAAHAEGWKTIAGHDPDKPQYDSQGSKGQYAHAEGEETKALNYAAHAEGKQTVASGIESHAGGNNSIASGLRSFAHGFHVNAKETDQVVFGKYNTTNANALFIVGNGTSDTDRKNAFEVFSTGDVRVAKNMRAQEVEISQPPVEANHAIRKQEFDPIATKVETLSRSLNLKYAGMCSAPEDVSSPAAGEVYTVRGRWDPVHESGMFNCACHEYTTLHFGDSIQYVDQKAYEWLKYYTTPDPGQKLVGQWKVNEPFWYGDETYLDYNEPGGPYGTYWDGYISCNFTSNGIRFKGIQCQYLYNMSSRVSYIRAENGQSVTVYEEETGWTNTNYQNIDFGKEESSFMSTDPTTQGKLNLAYSRFLSCTTQLTTLLSGTYLLYPYIHLVNEWAEITANCTVIGDDYGEYKYTLNQLTFDRGFIYGNDYDYYLYGLEKIQFDGELVDINAFNNLMSCIYKAPNLNYSEVGYELYGSHNFNKAAVAELGQHSDRFPDSLAFTVSFIANGTEYAGIRAFENQCQVEYLRKAGSENLNKEFVYTGNKWEELGDSALAMKEIAVLTRRANAITETITSVQAKLETETLSNKKALVETGSITLYPEAGYTWQLYNAGDEDHPIWMTENYQYTTGLGNDLPIRSGNNILLFLSGDLGQDSVGNDKHFWSTTGSAIINLLNKSKEVIIEVKRPTIAPDQWMQRQHYEVLARDTINARQFYDGNQIWQMEAFLQSGDHMALEVPSNTVPETGCLIHYFDNLDPPGELYGPTAVWLQLSKTIYRSIYEAFPSWGMDTDMSSTTWCNEIYIQITGYSEKETI